MTTTMQRAPLSQGQSHKATATTSKKPGAKDPDSKGIWLSMLDEVSRGKDLAEKQLIILGGTPTQQRDFLSTLINPPPSSSNTRAALPRRPNQKQRNNTSSTIPRPRQTIPVSNRFALGYTYTDVLDTGEEYDGDNDGVSDILARMSVYMLSNPSAALAPLLKPLFTAKTVPDTLVTVLLDWGDVFAWPAQLRQWVRVLRGVVVEGGLGEDVKEAMDEVMREWKGSRRGGGGEGFGSLSMAGGGGVMEEGKTPTVSLGPGEWEDGLGVPLSVVCVNAEKQERMEKDFGWQEGDFDFVLQWMRCVLLKHGASLIYTTSFDPNNVRTLIHSSLGIQSPLKRETVKHNVIDRDKILIPPNWDSWGKIRILREDFEMEKVANAWSVEIQSPPEAEFDTSTTTLKSAVDGEKEDGSNRESAVSIFTSSLPNPIANSKPYVPSTAADDVVTVQDPQTFLAEQAQILESLRQEDERAERRARKGAPTSAAGGGSLSPVDGDDAAAGRARIPEPPTGPYNINVGGMQVDAEEVTKRIREREADRDRDGDSNRTPRKEAGASGSGSGMATPEGGKMQNEALASYFAGLLKKAKGSSESPRGGSGSATER